MGLVLPIGVPAEGDLASSIVGRRTAHCDKGALIIDGTGVSERRDSTEGRKRR